jgi:hypothetical protein
MARSGSSLCPIGACLGVWGGRCGVSLAPVATLGGMKCVWVWVCVCVCIMGYHEFRVHPRPRWSACTYIGAFSRDAAPVCLSVYCPSL